MANTVFKLRRSTVGGKVPNTSTLSIGELGINLTDRILYSSDGTNVFEIGSNTTNSNVSNTLTIKALSANGSVGSAGQVLHSNGSAAYWAIDDQGVTSVASGNGLIGGTITTTGTLSVLANTGIVSNATGLYVNATYIGTLSANNTTYVNGKTEGNLNVNSAVTVTNNTSTNTFTIGSATYFVSNGNVGIGNTTPAQKLRVEGSASVTGNLSIESAGDLILASGVGIYANGSFGVNNQILATNSTGVYWTTAADAGLPVRQQFTGNGTTTSFAVPGGYVSNNINVYLNGILLRNGTEVDVSSGTNFVITPAPSNGALIDVIGSSAITTAGINTSVSQQFTANGTATSFTVTNGYVPNQIQVYLNGVKQIPGVDVDISSGSSVVFTVAPGNNHVVDVYGYQTAIIATSNALSVGANLSINSSSITLGNSTVNTQITAGNLALNGSELRIGNSTVNTVINNVSASFKTDVTITGNLYVTGTTVSVNTNTLDVKDLNITVAKGAGSASAANGAGITVDANIASLYYKSASNSWNTSVGLNVDAGNIGIGIDNTSSNYPLHVNRSQNNITAAIISNYTVGAGASAGFQLIGGTLNSNMENNLYDNNGFPYASFKTGSAVTGMYFDSAMHVFRSAAGSERMRLDSSGNLGIGTTSPSTKLDVSGTTTSRGLVTSNVNLGQEHQLEVFGTTGAYNAGLLFGSTNGNNRGLFKYTVGGGSLTYFNSSDATTYTERFRVDSVGRVGIGTTSPAGILDVVGGSYSTFLRSSVNWNFSTANLVRNASNNGSPRHLGMALDGDDLGSTTIGSFNAIWGAYDSAPTTGSTSAALNGAMVYGAYAGHRWVNNGTEYMRISNTGSVGIGWNAPTTRLSVLSLSTSNTHTIQMRGYRNYTAATYGGTSLIAMTDGTAGTHDLGAIRFEQNPDTADGHGALARLFAGGGSSAFQTNNEYLRATAITTGTGVDNIRLYTAGSERMRIDSSGRLGIGVTPAADLGRLQVYEANTAVGYVGGRFISDAAATGTSATYLRIEKGSNYGGAIGGYITQGVGSGLVFSTLNGGSLTDQMWLTNGGNVGIGTSNPSQGKLVVSGSAAVHNVQINNTITGNTIYGGSYTQLTFSSENALGSIIQVGGSGFLYGGPASLNFWNSSNAAMTFGTNSAERMRIHSDGNISIGNSTSGQKLDISGNIALRAPYPNIQIYPSSGTANQRAFRIEAGDGNLYFLGMNDSGTTTTYPFYISNSGNAWFNGNVGIGTTSPSAKLAVVGNIICDGTVDMNSSFIRNRIINGAFQIWQRGTTGTSSYLADRWRAFNTSSISRSTDVPSGYQYSGEFVGTSFPLFSQCIESLNCLDLVGKQVTISFWAKNVSGTANLYVELYSANAVDNFSAVTIQFTSVVSASPSSSWTYYTATSGVLPAAVANGLELRIVRNNASASTTRVTGVQVEEGTIATPYERRSWGHEFMLCERYFQQVGSGWTGMEETTTQYSMAFTYRTLMRAIPTITLITANVNTRIPSISVDRTIASTIVTYSASTVAAWVFLSCSGGNVQGRFIQSRDGANIFYANSDF